MCVSAARCFLSDVPFLVCVLKEHQTQTYNSYSAECRCISGVPLTAAVCRSPQTGGVPLQPAVCRSHHRCGIQRCAALTSGVPPPRSLAQAVPIFQNPLQKTLNRICFRPSLSHFCLNLQFYFASNHPVVLVLYRCLRSGSVGVTMMVLWQSFCTRGELV